jgi:tetratricopeptide (TPR) repeat protein
MRLYLQGRALFATGKRADVERAIDLFRRAAEVDPRFALPSLGMANAYYWLSSTYTPPTEVMPKAKAAAAEALARDALLGDAHALLGYVTAAYDWEWAAAEGLFRRAVECDPKSANVHTFYGLYLTQQGRTEQALAELRQTRELDPLTPEIAGYPALALYLARRPDQAIRELEETLARSKETYSLYAYLGLNYELKGDYVAAVRAFETVREKEPNPDGLGQLGHAYARAGRRDDARRVLDDLKRLRKGRYVSSYNDALLHAALGETDTAFDSLERATEERADWVACLNVDPRLDQLRPDPRFDALLRRVRLRP